MHLSIIQTSLASALGFHCFSWRGYNLAQAGAGVRGIGTCKFTYDGTITWIAAKSNGLIPSSGVFIVFVFPKWTSESCALRKSVFQPEGRGFLHHEGWVLEQNRTGLLDCARACSQAQGRKNSTLGRRPQPSWVVFFLFLFSLTLIPVNWEH